MTAANLALRFLLELAALAGIGLFVSRLAAGPLRIVLAAGAVMAVAAIWGTFAVPDDPSRSGNAPVPVSGLLRLLLELVVLLGGAFLFYASGYRTVGVVMAVLIIGHYAFSLDRLRWLMQQ